MFESTCNHSPMPKDMECRGKYDTAHDYKVVKEAHPEYTVTKLFTRRLKAVCSNAIDKFMCHQGNSVLQ